MNTCLIIGSSGLVGEHLIKYAEKSGQSVIGTYYKHNTLGLKYLNICSFDEVLNALSSWKPQIVYLPASLTNVDYCQLNPQESYTINVTGVQNIVVAANKIKAKLVYFSSDYIFDGLNGPYKEDDPANPICVYGHHKVLAEHFISLHSHDFLIIRTTVVYGWEQQGKNFIYRLIKTLQTQQPIKVPIDQIGNPTYAPNLAQVSIALAGADAQGVYHVVGPERVSRYEFSIKATKFFNLDSSLVIPVTTLELNQVAPRPLNAGMTANKVTTAVDVPLVNYLDGLQTMQKDYHL